MKGELNRHTAPTTHPLPEKTTLKRPSLISLKKPFNGYCQLLKLDTGYKKNCSENFVGYFSYSKNRMGKCLTIKSFFFKYSIFMCIKSHFSHLHHSVILWIFLDFSYVLGYLVLLLLRLCLHLNVRGSYWNPTKTILLK